MNTKQKQIKKFDAAQFEVLKTSGKMLKGGFSTASTGGTNTSINSNNCKKNSCSLQPTKLQ